MTAKFCPECGKALAHGARFCTGCGRAVPGAATTASIAPAEPAPLPEPPTPPSAQLTPPAPQFPPPRETREFRHALAAETERSESLAEDSASEEDRSTPAWLVPAVIAGVCLAMLLAIVLIFLSTGGEDGAVASADGDRRDGEEVVANEVETDIAPRPDRSGVIRLDSTNAVDVWITSHYSNGSRDGNPSGLDNEELQVGGWGDTYVSLLRFPPVFVDGSQVWLYLHNAADQGAPTDMTVRVITSPWNVGSDARMAWSAMPSVSTEYELHATAVAAGEWLRIDISEINAAWTSGTLHNYGLALLPRDTNNNFNEFISTNSPQRSLRPRIVWLEGEESIRAR